MWLILESLHAVTLIAWYIIHLCIFQFVNDVLYNMVFIGLLGLVSGLQWFDVFTAVNAHVLHIFRELDVLTG